MKEVDFSFVVPAYNVSSYIIDCLTSISSQSGNFECIVIDDGSTDDTGILAKKFCSQENGFFYFYKENGGLSSARNYGLLKSRGKYIIFVDSDDYISHSLLELVSEVAKKKNPDLICYDYKEVEDFLVSEKEGFRIREITSPELYKLPNFACIRVLSREFYVENEFPLGVIYEDVVTSSIANFISKKPYWIDAPLYFYRRRSGSITTGSVKNQFKLFFALDELKRRVEYKSLPRIIYCSAFVGLSKSILVSLIRLEDDVEYDFYANICKKNLGKIGFFEGVSSYSSVKNKLYFSFLKIDFFIYFMLKKFRFLIRVLDKKR